jgi:hypothetical protein
MLGRRKKHTPTIDPRLLRRAKRLDRHEVETWLDMSAMSLAQSIDAWRFSDAPADEVEYNLQAVCILWETAKQRRGPE